MPSSLKSPATFVLSLDFELAWGMRDLLGDKAQREECRLTREVVVPRMLELFERYEMPASWCTVGQLFDKEIPDPPESHFSKFEAPSPSWIDRPWFEGAPSGREEDIPDYLCPSLIERIRSISPPQEIGCHGFSHVIFGDPSCSRACAQSEIQACVERAEAAGIHLDSMVYPRNEAGHRDVLREHGFICYRGKGRDMIPGASGRVAQLSHILSVLSQRFAYPVVPQRDELGLWNIPASMMLFPAHGIRKYVPMSFRVRRAQRGLDAAVESGQVFHLWFHPINLAHETEGLLGALEQILRYASQLRGEAKLRFLSMGDLARECEGRVQGSACGDAGPGVGAGLQ